MGCPIERSCRLSRCLHQFLLRDWQRINEGLHRRLAVAPAPLMRTLIVVFREPGIKIFLQLRNRPVELLAECNAVELIEQRLVETLANAVRLRAPCDRCSRWRDRAHIRGARAYRKIPCPDR